MSLVDLIPTVRHHLPRPVPGWPAAVRRSLGGGLLIAAQDVSVIARHRGSAEILIEGGAVMLARVVEVRHDPGSSVIAFAGHCPVVGPPPLLVVTLAEREPIGPGLVMNLRWGGYHAPTSGRLPVDVDQGELLALWIPRQAEQLAT